MGLRSGEKEIISQRQSNEIVYIALQALRLEKYL